MIGRGDNMDYYSGAPDPNDFEYNNGGSSSGGGMANFFRNYSFIFLIVLAIGIAALILIFLFSSKDTSNQYGTKDDNSYLKSLEVYGGVIDPKFSSEEFKYTITAFSDYVTFDCKAASDKAKVEGCDESVEVTDGKVEYNIKVTAEDTNVTRYYFKIVRAEQEEVETENEFE